MELSQQRHFVVIQPAFCCCRGTSHSCLPQYKPAPQRQMSSRWFCLWKRSGPSDDNLNKYAIRVGNASGVWGSAGHKPRRDSVDGVRQEKGMRGDTQRQTGDVWNTPTGAVWIQTEFVRIPVFQLCSCLTEQQETKYLLTKYLILTL